MVEYGGVVSQGSSAIVGGGAGRRDMGRDIMDAIGDSLDKVAALPPEILLVLAAALLIGGLLVFKRA